MNCFILGTKTSSADVDLLFLPVYDNRRSVNIRQPLSLSMFFGVAYTMPKLRSFTTNFTLHRKSLPFTKACTLITMPIISQ